MNDTELNESELRAVVAVIFGAPADSLRVGTVVLAAQSYARRLAGGRE